MKFDFKDFLAESAIFEAHIDTHGEKKLFSTIHYKDREKEREGAEDVIKDIFHKTAEHLSKTDYGDNHKFVVTSKKHDRSVCFDHRKDKYNKKDNEKHLIATTIFPKGEHSSHKSKSIHLHVEGLNDTIFIELDETVGAHEVRRFRVTFTQPDWDSKAGKITTRKYDKTFEGNSFNDVNSKHIKPYLASKEGHAYHSHTEYVADTR